MLFISDKIIIESNRQIKQDKYFSSFRFLRGILLQRIRFSFLFQNILFSLYFQ